MALMMIWIHDYFFDNFICNHSQHALSSVHSTCLLAAVYVYCFRYVLSLALTRILMFTLYNKSYE